MLVRWLARMPLAAALLAPAAPSQTNSALSFQAGDFVQVPSSASLNSITSEITIEAWVRLGATAPLPTVIRRNEALGSPEPVYILRINAPPGATMMMLTFLLRIGPDSIGGFSTVGVEKFVPLSLNVWHHFAGTFDGGILRVYWDAALLDSTPFLGGIQTSALPLRIGSGGVGDNWVGEIDEVRLWSVARTQEQLASFRFSPLLGTEPGLVAYWRFDEAAGQSASDATGNGNQGQLGALPIVDPADPSWTGQSPPLGATIASIAPAFGASYAPTPVTVTGSGFTPGGSVLSVGGQPVAGATVVDGETIQALVPPGPPGPADVSVTSLYGTATSPGAWSWVLHLSAVGDISVASGGSVEFSLFATPANALGLYVLATSLSGTSPGFPLPGSPLLLNLNPDVWTEIGLQAANGPTFQGFVGVLDAQGEGNARFELGPIPITPAPIGQAIDFAYVVLQPFTGGFTLSSNPITVTLVP